MLGIVARQRTPFSGTACSCTTAQWARASRRSRSGKQLRSIPPASDDHIDSILLRSADLHHDVYGDFRQAVLIDGCGDRPFRLDWPHGTVVFLVGSEKQISDNTFAFPGPMSNGCLLRRVTVDDWESGKLEMALIEAGFQADKLSVWLLEVDEGWQLQELNQASAEVANSAALGSLLVGAADHLDEAEVSNSLAACGFLGSVRPQPEDGCRFVVQQQRPSLLQEGTYHRHVQAAEEADEDFLGNFS